MYIVTQKRKRQNKNKINKTDALCSTCISCQHGYAIHYCFFSSKELTFSVLFLLKTSVISFRAKIEKCLSLV